MNKFHVDDLWQLWEEGITLEPHIMPDDYSALLRGSDRGRVTAVLGALREYNLEPHFVGSITNMDREYRDIDIVGVLDNSYKEPNSKFMELINRKEILIGGYRFNVKKEESKNEHVVARYSMAPKASIGERMTFRRPATIDLIIASEFGGGY